ncbi:hypothetical protein ABFS82_05G112700 [Erythranthe guttata]|uniref:F-box/LRR-repeat protein At3g26922-like isoform X1 n=1 Tax=Erythranthe guttata TaxID=4155 RepID=UPI00064DCE57|nr:PREDICTED: F-box/LRR-repeat protein At3g26922-like isoform X1 [Erythranthe guttata]|eukprot:XP_012850521.1 PREDICTED: F-box/LRR-repeat protein At3g26922-like isoform X1 [Erythranthe guttata]
MAVERLQIHTNFQPKKCGETSIVGDEDRISQLPDDILVNNILPLLSLKEAGRTSVLSSRWTNLWAHIPRLNFDAKSALHVIERHKYVEWMDSVIRSREFLSLKEFNICYRIDKSSRKSVTRWLEFAFARQLERLTLDFQENTTGTTYCFPEALLNRSTLVGFKSLKAIVFKSVSLSGGAIEFLLRNCQLLEQLVVQESETTTKLQVCGGSSLKLEHLEMVHCQGLKSLKVSAPRLTTLKVSRVKGLLLEKVPMLVNVSVNFCDDNSVSIKHAFSVLACCIPQLQTLCLTLYNCGYGWIGHVKEIDEICELPVMPKLNKLVIEYIANGDESLVRLSALIRASPNLEEFLFHFKWCRIPRKDRKTKAATTIRSPHNHLKVFKFRGYYGCTNDVELLSYVLENCAVLEKIIIDPNDGIHPKEEYIPRKVIKQKLEPQVPQRIELVIL